MYTDFLKNFFFDNNETLKFGGDLLHEGFYESSRDLNGVGEIDCDLISWIILIAHSQ